MSDFDLFAAPKVGSAQARWPNISASTGADAKIRTQQRKSINFVGSSDFCRPDS